MNPAELAVTGACAALLAAVHLSGGRLRFFEAIPRSRLLSGAGGVAVAYVFIHVLPELAAAQEHFTTSNQKLLLEQHIYLLALGGLTLFYGLERAIKVSGKGDSGHSTGLFWLHIGTFAVYNSLFGYLLLRREDDSPREVLTYTAAIALHFLVNDFGLYQEHAETYRRRGQWVLVASILAGWLLGTVVDLNDATTGAIFAVLAGGVVLNVLKEELPEERKSRFSAFLAGVIGYAAVLQFWG